MVQTKKVKILGLIVIGIFFPSLCLANGAVPILLLLNGYVFTVGFLWIFLVEFFYLFKIFQNQIRWTKIAIWAFNINIISGIAGGFILLILPIIYVVMLRPIFDALGRISSEQLLSTLSLQIDFLVTFLCTVFIEYSLFRKLASALVEIPKKKLFKHIFAMNLISYIGLILIVVITLYWL